MEVSVTKNKKEIKLKNFSTNVITFATVISISFSVIITAMYPLANKHISLHAQ